MWAQIGLDSLFNGISTFVGYLMPKPPYYLKEQLWCYLTQSLEDKWVHTLALWYSVRQWSGRPKFNPRSSHTKDFKNNTSLFNTQHIKGKVEQSRKGVAPFLTPRCSSYWKWRLWVALDYSRQLNLLTLPTGFYAKVIARLEFLLAYYNSTIHRFNHYTTRTHPCLHWKISITTILRTIWLCANEWIVLNIIINIK